jgi:pyridoxamine 5'-phosphate oxidase
VADDPIAKFRRWYAAAERAGVPYVDAMALATADRRGTPSVRFVLLKGVDERGFVFYTDGRSRKGRELAVRPRASVAFHWHLTGAQVRIEGRVVPVSPEEADAYWASRPRGSRLAATSSVQSAPMPDYAWLLARWRRLRATLGRAPVPRPAAWKGYRIVPDAIEFWRRGAHRLHQRTRYRRTRTGWRREMLQP